MLYEGLIKYVRHGKSALEDEQNKDAHEKLLQAQDIVTELMSSLDMEVGGEVAEELYMLYDFILNNLIEANVENDPSKLEEVLPILNDLNEAWDEVINEKGMTIEKARKQTQSNRSEEMDDSSQEVPSENGAPATKNVEAPDDSSLRQSPESDQGSFDGNVTYGDI
jgi:flagellar protein FliS